MNIIDEQSEQVDLDALVSIGERALSEEDVPSETELTVTLVSDDRIFELGREHLGKTGPTDVLSFPIEQLEPGVPPAAIVGGPPPMIGDVVIAPAYVRTQAQEFGVTFEEEMALMLVHGILHLLGYDHVSEADAERMEDRERHILGLFGMERR